MFGVLLALFIVVPLVELYLLIRVGDEIGLWRTVAIIVATGVVGASLARQQGLATLARFQSDMARGQLPQGALVDGLLILVAGAVLLTPGLLTDAFGFLLLIPPFRRVFAGWLGRTLKSRIKVTHDDAGFGPTPRRPDENVIDVEYKIKDPDD